MARPRSSRGIPGSRMRLLEPAAEVVVRSLPVAAEEKEEEMEVLQEGLCRPLNWPPTADTVLKSLDRLSGRAGVGGGA